jgi:acyl carrier protein
VTQVASDVDERLTECFITVFPFLDKESVSTVSRQASEEWDSLATVNLVTVIEEQFDITFDDDTVDTLVSYETTRDAVVAALELS